MLKNFRAGDRLRYPITISKFLKNKGDEVQRGEALLQYTFKFERTIGDPALNEERTVEETGYADWDCPTEGTINKWLVKVGDVLTKSQLFVAIDEPCPHDMQYAGLCTKCGKDMKEITWATESMDTDRATIAMVHDNVALTVSAQEAMRAEIDLQRRLLQQRKLSLVVDLDQTIIHACIDPTVGEWQRDPTNPNHGAVKDVRTFQLDDGPRGVTSGCWYYIKLRPGLVGFLERMSEYFEMHVYTMGTRAYAEQIANIVDPDKKLFGHRIISRDENGSVTAKSLQRLFPVNTNMVIVIDDRADVWPRNRQNLIKVTPYDFFKGIGDINSAYLPAREDALGTAAAPAAPPAATSAPLPIRNGDASKSPNAPGHANKIPEHEKAVSANSNGVDDALLQLQVQEQERALEKQLKERPLLHMQEELDKEDTDPAESEPSEEETTTPPGSPEQQNGHSPTPHHRHNLLRDDDNELACVEQHLTATHKQFYEKYDARRASRHRIQEITSELIPNVGAVLDYLKGQVLKNCTIVLTGIVPQGVDVMVSEIGLQIMSFGADLKRKPTLKTTHLVVSSARPRTDKVRKAARIPTIKIVNQDWLAACLAEWRRVDETSYLMDINPGDRANRHVAAADDDLEDDDEDKSQPKVTIVNSGEQNMFEEADESAGDVSDDEDEDDEEEDPFGVIPSEPASPVQELKKMDWDDMDDELAEFMGSDVESDSEAESMYQGSGKRKHDDLASEDGDSAEEGTGSTLSKKQKLAKARTTGLRNVENVGENGAGDDAAEEEPEGNTQDGGEEEEDNFDELEAELEAEFEKEDMEDQEGKDEDQAMEG
ncbi:FCP1-like phosphatase [Apiospora rasikravindrae]|uniref:RNA polymerase II subunit A C-terminal domain phosphatase n=1 Tax=Apiospora rasikravindrae TaxID=990691 RepID=A0ABR1TBU2_9PEZI